MTSVSSLTAVTGQRSALRLGVGVLLLLVVQLLAYQLWLSYQETVTAAEKSSRNYAAIFASRLDATLRRTDLALQDLSRRIPVGALNAQDSVQFAGEVRRELQAQRRNFDELLDLRVFDRSGELLYSSDAPDTLPLEVADREDFRALRAAPQNGPLFSEELVAPASRRPGLIVARALVDDDGAFLGMVSARLDLEHYQQIFRAADLGATGAIILRRSDEQRLLVRWPQVAADSDAVERIYGTQQLARYPFSFVVGVSRDEVLAGWCARLQVVGVCALLLLAMLTVLLLRLRRSDQRQAQVVADLVDSERKLSARSERLEVFQRLAENAGQGIGMAHPDGQLIYTNAALRQMLALAPDSACSDYSFNQFYRDSEWRRLRDEVLPAVLETGQWTGELELMALDGRRIPTIHTLFVVHQVDGEPPIIANVLADLSERQQMEKRNDQLLAEMQTLLSNAMVGIVHLRERRVVYCNRRIEEIFGYQPGELVGESSECFYASREIFEQTGARGYAVVAAGGAFSTEMMLKRKDGSLFWGALTGRAVDPQMPQQGSTWVFADVSERRQAEAESEKLLQAVEQTPVAIVMTRHDGEIEYVNPSFTRITGYSRLEAIGRNPRFLQSGETPAETYRDMWRQLLDGKVWSGLLRNRRKNGELFWEKESISPVFGDHGEVTHFLAVKEDVTERLRTEQQLRESEEAFRRLFDDAKDPLLLLKDGSYIDCNRAALELLGYRSKAELIGHGVADISPAQQPDGQPSAEKSRAMVKAAQRFGYHRFEWMHQRADTAAIAVEVTLTPITLHGEVILHALWRDISERQLAEKRLRLLAGVFEHSAEAIMVSDRDNHILEVNDSFCRLTGYTADDVRGRDPGLLSSGRSAPEDYRQMWQAIQTAGHWQGEVWDRRKDGSCYPKWLAISTMHGADGAIEYYIGSFVDISERKAAEEKITHLAHFDTLTDLPNRSNLQDRLEQALASARHDTRNSSLAVMFLDLDRFKNINDTLGHHVGDALLLEVSQRLRACVRQSDVVARLGGDEFVVVLNGADATAAERVAGKILDALSPAYQFDGHSMHTTSSIGIAIFPNDGESVEVLMRNADAAMYHAKSTGRNNLQFFTASMNEQASDRRQIEEGLHLALQQGQFVVYYQPQVDATRRVFAAEALLRWQHPENGLVSPARFIPLAEDNGLIVPIGQWVLETACAQLKAWSLAAPTRDLQLAVNVSARQFRQANFVEQLAATVNNSGADPSRLKLELTESLVLDNVADTITKMNAIKLLGVSFSMDDFGTGYSSLSYLSRLPLDQLKIDRAFVSRLPDNQSDAVIAQTIVTMGRSLGLKVIAEGVESEAQFAFLDSHGCDGYQGYLFGRPVPIDDFARLLNDHTP